MRITIETKNDEFLYNSLNLAQQVILTIQNKSFKVSKNMIVTKGQTIFKLDERNSIYELEECTEIIENFKE